MSVKGKVKRLNREIDDLKDQIDRLLYTMKVTEMRQEKEIEVLENLIKFFVVNQVGTTAEGGVHIEKKYVDKLDYMNIKIWYEYENNAYVIKLKEENDEKRIKN